MKLLTVACASLRGGVALLPQILHMAHFTQKNG